MAPPNPSLDRRWLQVAGLPPEPVHAAVRSEIDRVTSVEAVRMTSRIILFDQDGPLGLLDLMPAARTRVEKAVADPPETRVPDPAAGDTIIIPLDPSDPKARELLAAGGSRVIEREAPPPLDLPGDRVWRPSGHPDGGWQSHRPTRSERIWKALGFGEPAWPPEQDVAGMAPASLHVATVVNLSLADRLRLLVTGRLAVNTAVKTDVPVAQARSVAVVGVLPFTLEPRRPTK